MIPKALFKKFPCSGEPKRTVYAGLFEPSLLAEAISTKLSCTGSFYDHNYSI